MRSRPTEAELRKEVCSRVGDKWRAVSTYLDVPSAKVAFLLDSHKHNVEEAFVQILCYWGSGQGATWDVLLGALRMAGLNAQANELQKWGESRVPSVSCVVMTWSDAYCSESDFLL